jgi:hypothetical protein
MAVTKGGEEKHETTFRCISNNHCIFLWLRTTWAALRARDYALGKLRQ